jgi:hypothetical protein
LPTHVVFVPGERSWLEDLESTVELKPDGWKDTPVAIT